MKTAVVVLGLSIMMSTFSALPAVADSSVYVVVTHGPVDTRSDFSLAQLSEMASRVGQSSRHAPVGFYVGNFSYSIRADACKRSNVECPGPVDVTVSVSLTDRYIQIARELAGQSCAYTSARDHYLRHAAADDAVVSQFGRALEAASRQVSLPPLAGSPSLSEEDRRAAEQTVAAMVERGLHGLDQARADARSKVDSVDEIKKLSKTCASAK